MQDNLFVSLSFIMKGDWTFPRAFGQVSQVLLCLPLRIGFACPLFIMQL